MSFASLCVFTYAYPVSFLSKCHAKNRKEVRAVRTSYRKEVLALLTRSRKEVLALLTRSRKEVLAVSRTQAQATCNQPQEELLLADAKRSSCACIIFGLHCCMYAAGCIERYSGAPLQGMPIFKNRVCYLRLKVSTLPVRVP